MGKTITRILLICFLLLGCFSNGSAAAQTSEGELYIPETGHWIRGEYLKMYQSAGDPLLLFGYPITDEMIDPIDGQHTQYFEKARFDLTINENGSFITIAPLGELLYTAGTESSSRAMSTQACRFFPDTGKSVCQAFLEFYDAHQGAIFFGNPISELEYAEGRYIQYFQNCRMEWRPELPAGQRVALTNLGERYFNSRLGNRADLSPSVSKSPSGELVQLMAHAFVSNSLLPAKSIQELFITVQDQNLNPIAGAMITVKIVLPDGTVEVYRPQMTNSHGISSLIFNVGDLAVNDVVQAQIEVSYLGFTTLASTWFRIWW